MSVNGFGPVSLVYPDNSPVSNEPISVRSKETGTLATLYTSIAGTVVGPNPISTDALGVLSFYAETGAYEIEILSTGFKTTVVVYEAVGVGQAVVLLNQHIAAPEPHPAYDVDMQDLTVLLENGLI